MGKKVILNEEQFKKYLKLMTEDSRTSYYDKYYVSAEQFNEMSYEILSKAEYIPQMVEKLDNTYHQLWLALNEFFKEKPEIKVREYKFSDEGMYVAFATPIPEGDDELYSEIEDLCEDFRNGVQVIPDIISENNNILGFSFDIRMGKITLSDIKEMCQDLYSKNGDV